MTFQYPNSLEFLAGGQPTDIFDKAIRELQVYDLKRLYDNNADLMIEQGLCTQEEFDATALYQNPHQDYQTLRDQVVGQETF